MIKAIAGVAVAVLLSAGVVAGTSTTATADAAAQVINIPSGVRAHPRNVSLIGQSSEGVLYASEQDPTSLSLGDLAGHLQGTDGTDTPIDGTSDRMVGNREVAYTPDSEVGDVRSRVLPSLTWTDTDVPTGWNYLGYNTYGAVVDKVFTDTLEVVPWGGGTAVAVTGLPTTSGVEDVGPFDASGMLLGVESNGAASETTYYLDAATHRAVEVHLAWHASFGLGSSELAWTQVTGGKTVIASMTRPSIAHPYSAIHLRVNEAGVGLETLQPIGTTVVEFHGNEYGFFDFTAATAAPVYAISYTGGVRKLLVWGHDVMADGSSILAVGGATAVNESIYRIVASTGAKTSIVSIPTVQSHVKEVAIDGDTLYTTDDTASAGAVEQRQLTFGDSPSASAPTTLATGADIDPSAACGLANGSNCSGIQTGDGTTVWQDPGVGEQVRTGGVTTLSPVTSEVGPVSGNWALTGDDNTSVVNLSNGVVHGFTNVQQWLGLDDGELYLTGSEVSAPAADIVARDLATNTNTLLTGDTAGCTKFDNLHSAGPWLVFSCYKADDSFVWRVVDQTGATPQWEFPDNNETLWVGDGFMVRVTNGSTLQWAPLAASSADWTNLDTLADDGGAIAVSRGAIPTVAWVDASRQAHAALLPVTTSAAGALVKLSAAWDAASSSIDVSWSWSASDPSAFTVSTNADGATSQTVGGDARSVSIPLASFTSGTTVSLAPAGSPTTWTVTAGVPQASAPSPSLTALPTVTTTPTIPLTASTSNNAGAFSVDVREQSGSWDHAMGAWTQPAAMQGVDPGTAFAIPAVAGSSYCFEERVRDVWGNVTDWTTPDCTDVLLPVTSLAHSGTWTSVWNEAGSAVIAYTSASTTAHITTTVRGHYVALLVHTGPSDGSVVVSYASSRWELSLNSSISAYELVELGVPTSTTAITISPAVSGKPITIEGIIETAY